MGKGGEVDRRETILSSFLFLVPFSTPILFFLPLCILLLLLLLLRSPVCPEFN